MSFTGNVNASAKKELLPNLTNPSLMDVCRIMNFSAEYEIVTKTFKNGKIKSYKVFYHVGTQVIERLEIGSYYDKR